MGGRLSDNAGEGERERKLGGDAVMERQGEVMSVVIQLEELHNGHVQHATKRLLQA